MSVFHDEVEIEDFEYDEESETYSYPCPCGDCFLITRVKGGEGGGSSGVQRPAPFRRRWWAGRRRTRPSRALGVFPILPGRLLLGTVNWVGSV